MIPQFADAGMLEIYSRPVNIATETSLAFYTL